jgi:hypothetical protein
MFRKSLMALAGSAAVIVAGTAIAAPGGHGGGHGEAGMNANAGVMTRINSQAPMSIGTTGTRINANTNTGSQALMHSQGPANASPNGIAHANQHSVLARGAVSSSTLAGLTTGLTVQNSAGTSLGTVSRVITGTDGSIRAVVVTSATGQTFTLAPSSLMISGGVVTTTSTTIRR